MIFNPMSFVPFRTKFLSGLCLAPLPFIFILLAGNCIQWSEAYPMAGEEFELLGGEAESSPCICNDRFYKTCPQSSACSPRRQSIRRRTFLTEPMVYDVHDDEHPDHVEEPTVKVSNFKNQGDITIEGDRVIRHRKVYLSEKEMDKQPIIHPMTLTIPVEYKEDPAMILPPPKPLFKMRKYTTVIRKPETELVPVKTTIIKPVGVTQDQFIKKP